jgi:hypothetical protein
MAYLEKSTECGISSSARELAVKNVPTLAGWPTKKKCPQLADSSAARLKKGRNKNVSAAEFWPDSPRKDRKWAKFLKCFCVLYFFHMKV